MVMFAMLTAVLALHMPQVKAKKTEFEGMNEEEKKAHKKKVQQAKNNSNKVLNIHDLHPCV
jgi:hypothetical protein